MHKLKGTRIEYHILQSFPVTCLNRDDVGAPKSAMVGGVTRARVSSQCWKRQVRMQMQALGVKTALRTKQVSEVLTKACMEAGAEEGRARRFSEAVAGAIADKTLFFFSEAEARAIAEAAKLGNFDLDFVIRKNALTPEFRKIHKKYFKPAVDGLDIALFGRMVAQLPELNIPAAASFSHAISTHRSDVEIDFFTALDDDPMGLVSMGSAHMDSLSFNSATYYRYVSLDLGQLAETLCGVGLADAVSNFTRALYLAVPAARQTTMAGLNPWNYARIFIRRGQGMQICMDEPVYARKGKGFLAPSIEYMDRQLARMEQQAGSLFGREAEFTFGKPDAEISIDYLVEGLSGYVKPYEVAA